MDRHYRMREKLVKVITLLTTTLIMIVAVMSTATQAGRNTSPARGSPTQTRYPLKASSNGRYLVDQDNTPVFLVGDAPQGALALLDETQWTYYLADRQARGVNTLLVSALCDQAIAAKGAGLGGCTSRMLTYDGIAPFTSGDSQSNYDVSTPNEAYWVRVDSYIKLAARYEITVLLDTWDTASLTPLMESNGKTKMYDFGVFLGNRYKEFPNIIWMTGFDFQTWKTSATDNDLFKNVMAGIASVDKNHLQTTELDYNRSKSLDDSLLEPYTSLDGVYDYYCTYSEVQSAYNAAAVPVFFTEGYYEHANADNWTSALPATTAEILRRQEWWSWLAGASGHIYGNMNIWPFVKNWQDDLGSIGITQFGYLVSFMKRVAWYQLVPDQRHVIVTAGYGTPNLGTEDNACIVHSDYVATAYFSDHSGSVSFTPVGTTLTVNLSQFSGPVNAEWYDPTNARYLKISSSPLSNTRDHKFATPGKNATGGSDWVLLLKLAGSGT